MTSKQKVALVSSVGGHLTELLALKSAFEDLEHFYVFNDEAPFQPPKNISVYTVAHAERDLLVAKNLLEFYRIFKKEKPTVMLSTGAGPAVPAAVVAKMLGIRVVFVESVAAVHQPTLTGILMQPFCDTLFVQWPQIGAHLKEGRWAGNIFGSS